jgi:hypothetical protein
MNVFKRHKLEPLLPKVLYTWTLMRREVHEKVLKPPASSPYGFDILEIQEYAVPDVFASILDKNESIERIIRFQKGYWAQTIRDSLVENGVP